jgi:hypothetical protein
MISGRALNEAAKRAPANAGSTAAVKLRGTEVKLAAATLSASVAIASAGGGCVGLSARQSCDARR